MLPPAHLFTKITSALSPSLPPLNASISLLFLQSISFSLPCLSSLPLSFPSFPLSLLFFSSLSTSLISLSPLNVFLSSASSHPLSSSSSSHLSLRSHCLYCSLLLLLLSFHCVLSTSLPFFLPPPLSPVSPLPLLFFPSFLTATTVSIFLNEAAVQQSIPV